MINITHLCFVAIFWPVTLWQGGLSKSCTLPCFLAFQELCLGIYTGSHQNSGHFESSVALWLYSRGTTLYCTFCVSLASESNSPCFLGALVGQSHSQPPKHQQRKTMFGVEEMFHGARVHVVLPVIQSASLCTRYQTDLRNELGPSVCAALKASLHIISTSSFFRLSSVSRFILSVSLCLWLFLFLPSSL